ncbi:MAG: beta-lactamase regulating signal transducer with metallopeptidase domain [Planctomycetaceae bacterium]|jgi:beta-lactamase regulating signal transducer with metallopeptidase domain
MNRTLLTVSAVLSTSSLLLVDSALKGGVLLLLAALVAVLLRRDSAATRHLVWQVSIVGMLVVPVFSAVLPQWRVLPAWAVISAPSAPSSADVLSERIPDEAEASIPASAALTPSRSDSPPISSGRIDVESIGASPAVVHRSDVEVPAVLAAGVSAEIVSEPPLREWSALDALPILWLVGFSVLIARLMAARLMLLSGERRGRIIAASQKSAFNERGNEPSDEAIFDAFKAACQQLAVRRPVRLLIHSEQTIPVVWGILRLRLLLPQNARSWSAEQLQSVLLHELAHIKRRDAFSQLLAQMACALHWFNPLVWFAAWRLHVERERACDDLVLANGVPPSAYAEHLLDVATRFSTARWTQACGLAMARKSSLEGRLVAVLNGHSNRRSVSASVAALSLLVGFGVAVPIAMLRPTDASSAEDEIVVTSEDAASDAAIPKDSTPDDTAPNDTSTANAQKYGPDDWAGWFTNQVSHRRLKDGTYPPQAFKYLREFVTEDLSGKAKAAGDDGARAWLELTAAEQNWKADEFTRLVAQIAAWDLTVVHRALPREEFASRCSSKPGKPATPEELRGFNFGLKAENGLRVAWVLDPSKTEYAVGDSLNCRVVIHNSGSQPVQFLGGLDFQEGTWSIRDAAGKAVPTKASPYGNVWMKPRNVPLAALPTRARAHRGTRWHGSRDRRR